MKILILCGGQGTRLREETEYRPKPLVPVGGKPILWHIMKQYSHYGHRDFVLALGYRGEMIKEYFLNYEAMNSDFTIQLGSQSHIQYHGEHSEQDFRVTLADTGSNTMTGGRIQKLAKYIEDDHFMVTYGDGVSDVDIGKLLQFHQEHGKLATVTCVQPVSRFGSVEIDSQQKVHRFAEKPQNDAWINAGFFIFHKKVLDYIGTDPQSILERDPLEHLARDGQLMAYQHEGFFYAMDTYREYMQLNELWNQGAAPWKVW